MHIKYSVVIPAFNEEKVIEETHKRLKQVMDSTGEEYELIFVNDGSKDKTCDILKKLHDIDGRVKIISFSKNFGHQAAITAGMDYASGEAVVVIDADLQDPPEVILKMIEKWKQGYDVVYGKRLERKGETAFKRWTASIFYRLLKSMTNIDIPVDTGDFRLIDRKVCDVMKRLREKSRYIRGLVSWVGFRQTSVEYVREPRWAGTTKYTLSKMLKLAADGITSFSYIPLKLPTYFGAIFSAAGLLSLIIILIKALIFIPHAVSIWGVALSAILLLNGLTFIFLGIFGEYIGRIYEELKDRPLYIVDYKVGFEEGYENESAK